MRKAIIITILITGILLLGMGVILLMTKSDHIDLSATLPNGPVAYVHMYDTHKNWEKIVQAPFWKEAKKANLEIFLRNMGVGAKEMQYLKQATEEIFDEQNREFIKKILGQEFAVALYPGDVQLRNLVEPSPVQEMSLGDQLITGLVLVTRIPADMQALFSVTGYMQEFGPSVTVTNYDYSGHLIQTLSFDKYQFEVSYVNYKGLLFAAVNEEIIKQCLDVLIGGEPSLIDDPNLKRVKAVHDSRSAMVAYWDVSKVISGLKQQALELSYVFNRQLNEDQVGELLQNIDGFQLLNASVVVDKITEIRFKSFVNMDQMNDSQKQKYLCASPGYESLSFIPNNALTFFWNSCIDLREAFEQVNNVPSQGSGLVSNHSGRFDKIKNLTGIDIQKDLMPNLGNEVGGYMTNIHQMIFPIPELLFFVEVKNQEAIRNLMSSLTNFPFVQRQQEEYKNINIQYFNTPFTDVIQPGYAMIDKFLIIALNRRMIQTAIDARESGEGSLEKNPDYAEVSARFSGEVKAVQYFQPKGLIEKLGTVFGWLDKKKIVELENVSDFKSDQRVLLNVQLGLIEKISNDIKEMRQKLAVLEEEIDRFRGFGMDVADKEQERALLVRQVDNKEKDFQSAKMKRLELQSVVDLQESKENQLRREKQNKDYFIYPLISALRTLRSVSTETVLDETEYAINIYFQ
ncbi:MAG: DUF3352 domain-containing protein [Candidatus Omnitrophica bacterium]|nr:DUF3352 domain-containing protein [Candidatus Omnitrophota bacterium]